jgi:chromosome segregation ATPase
MTCGKKALLVVMLTGLLGLWGCTQGGSSSSTSARLRELEARSARLEDDYKTAVAARDQARKKATALDEQRSQLVQQVEQLLKVAKERDDLRTQLTARAAEREALQANLLQFSRELQNLAAKIDHAASGSTAPLLSAPPPQATPPSPAS